MLATMERSNAACNAISEYAWDTQVFSKFKLQKAIYYECGESTGDQPSTASSLFRVRHRSAQHGKPWLHGSLPVAEAIPHASQPVRAGSTAPRSKKCRAYPFQDWLPPNDTTRLAHGFVLKGSDVGQNPASDVGQNPARCSRANSRPGPSTLTPTPSARSSTWLPSSTYRI